ncbi:hypothetical protein B0H11DRAFT_2284634 [Mycena galericulata]|nr:hypothetical protein B0H11DRAFT_2284634 [Mycena galericulata]
MVFIATSFILAACLLPSAMGLTLNTPAGTDADGVLDVTWTTVSTDPVFAIELVGPVSIDAATGVVPSTLKESVNLGSIPPGTYKLQAVVGDDIEKVLSTSGEFTVGAAGAAIAGAGDNSAAGGAAAGSGAVDIAASTFSAAPATATPAKSSSSSSKSSSKKGKGKGKGKKHHKGKKAAKKAPAKKAPAKGAKKSRAEFEDVEARDVEDFEVEARELVSSAKFGRRELYRD